MNFTNAKTTIIITDDQSLTYAGIRATLEQTNDMEVLGSAKDDSEIFDLIRRLGPQVLLLDLKTPALHSI